jgi:uncharacterized protein YdeI (YjbR/CyaY-like superfamily)
MIMDQKIFTLNLSVEATSAYILMCTLAESGTPVTIESAKTFWNDTPEALVKALDELQRYSIIYEALDANQVRQYHLNPSNLWEKPVSGPC